MSDLIDAAKAVRKRAYAPYSGYKVGAAIRDADGRIWTGCNVENVAFPSSMCAERNAIGAMLAGGGNAIVAITVFTRDGGTPCGGCLQVLFEFSQDPACVTVEAVSDDGTSRRYSLADLMPNAFRSKDVSRTERESM